uniref:MJ0042-type zinc finger domain-containing protein n=1 Tax=uncultured Acinetobacter sp. TaxID=165433 RepID=UPI002610CFC1|nr:MJ0042-type zinc finger domain-containing protein [uncultured Acinetobacter sp.]
MRYYSQCPNCQSTYELTLMQLNIAQGKVRCAECHATFDAFAHFILDPDYLPNTNPQNFIHYSLQHDTKDIQTNPFDLTAHASKNASIIDHVMDIMNSSVEGSRLNLYTYLNHLDTMSPNQIGVSKFTTTLTPKIDAQTSQVRYARKTRITDTERSYYVTWGVINFLLVLLLIFQIFFFYYI